MKIKTLRGGSWFYNPDKICSAFRFRFGHIYRSDRFIGFRLTKVRRTKMTAHKHADLMAQYAQDASETEAPWMRWEVKWPEEEEWWLCNYRTHFDPLSQYRRRPDCHNQENVENGGECYFNTCKHHCKDEPLCGASDLDPYAELKEAFAKGKTIEHYDHTPLNIWEQIRHPAWVQPVEQYRVKPKTVKMWQWAYKFPKSGSDAIYLSNQFFTCEQEVRNLLGESVEAWKLPWTEIEV